jgi:hypothetical protein
MSREFNPSHNSGSDFEDALVGFSLVPNWLKMAMEQDQHPHTSVAKRTTLRSEESGQLNSPPSSTMTSNVTTPASPRLPQLHLSIPKKKELLPLPGKLGAAKLEREEDDDRRYWEEDDDGYWAEMDEQEHDEDLEEAYRSVI